MRANDIDVGQVYFAEVSGRVVPLRVEHVEETWRPPVGTGWKGKTLRPWVCRDELTGRKVVVRSAQQVLALGERAL